MSAANQGSEESGVEDDARDGSDSPIVIHTESETSLDVTPVSAG